MLRIQLYANSIQVQSKNVCERARSGAEQERDRLEEGALDDAHGGDVCLTKPFEPKTLLGNIQELLEKETPRFSEERNGIERKVASLGVPFEIQEIRSKE